MKVFSVLWKHRESGYQGKKRKMVKTPRKKSRRNREGGRDAQGTGDKMHQQERVIRMDR